MGRSAGYEQTGQGFMNFKLENVYVGAIPLLFALLGLATAIRRRREDPEASAAALAWGALCVVALLLAFGKFFVLYKPLSWLPGIGSIRNPNKFIHFFQMAWGVLAAFGLDAALQMEPRAAKKWTGSSALKWGRTTICPNRSSRANCWPGSGPSCAAPVVCRPICGRKDRRKNRSPALPTGHWIPASVN